MFSIKCYNTTNRKINYGCITIGIEQFGIVYNYLVCSGGGHKGKIVITISVFIGYYIDWFAI